MTRKIGWYSLLVALGLLPAAAAVAGPGGAAGCNIGKFISSTSTFYFDVNGNGVWNGQAAGDALIVLFASGGAGEGFLGDFNDDGIDDAGKQVTTRMITDKNGNRTWDGNAGGDSNTDFAVAFGTGTPFGFDAGSPDVVGRYVESSSTFYIDANGNGVWNGNAGGDVNSAFGASFGTGTGVIGDWNGDGDDEVGRVVGTNWYIDLNDNNAWNGNAGGDRASNFGAAFAPYTAIMCDWDGDGDDDIGKVINTTFAIDLNGNLAWNGNAGGDRQSNFAIGGAGDGLGGVWSNP